MATIKSYTDLQQSKKLAEILPLESADMYYEPSAGFCTEPSEVRFGDIKYAHPRSIRCWSLAALLEQLPYEVCDDDENSIYLQIDKEGDVYRLVYTDTYEDFEIIETDRYEHFVDACYEMIVKLPN